jgi:hypothetical protein
MREGNGSSTDKSAAAQPRLLFFRTTKPDLPDFISLHLAEHVRCLAQFFDVEVISGDCDYDQICDTSQPDLALFESGVYAHRAGIRHANTHPQVPKIGFLNADAYCESRARFLSDMAEWGVTTFFTLSVAMAEYTPEIADRLFVWPNFVDDRIFRDYAEPKIIPVLFTGSQAKHYPWRNRVSQVVSKAYPTMTCPHAGWLDRGPTSRMMHGESYARLLNSARVVPTCGTIAHEVVRKHFEIPAAGTCLVAEGTASLRAAGFADMENCVFADEADVLDKLDYLFSNPAELARITAAGYRLVHSRHTASQRNELLQWLTLHKRLSAGEQIIQPGPFAALEVVRRQEASNGYVISGGVDRDLLRRGEQAQQAGRYALAESLYRRCLSYHLMREPTLRLAECALATGRPADALKLVRRSIAQSLEIGQAAEPDPVEWACYSRALLCSGDVRAAARSAFEFPALHHEELNRMRSALAQLSPSASRTALVQADNRASVHGRGLQSSHDWLGGLCQMLTACTQPGLAKLLRSRQREFQSALAAAWLAPGPTPTAGLAGKDAGPGYPMRVGYRAAYRAKAHLRPWKQRFSRRFLEPDAFGRLAGLLAEQEPVQRAYVLGSSARRNFDRAVTHGFRANPVAPVVLYSRAAERGATQLASGRLRGRARPGTGAHTRHTVELDISNGDLIFVLGEAAAAGLDVTQLHAARVIVIDGISGRSGLAVHERIAELDGLTLVACDPADGDGYAVYRRAARWT